MNSYNVWHFVSDFLDITSCFQSPSMWPQISILHSFSVAGKWINKMWQASFWRHMSRQSITDFLGLVEQVPMQPMPSVSRPEPHVLAVLPFSESFQSSESFCLHTAVIWQLDSSPLPPVASHCYWKDPAGIYLGPGLNSSEGVTFSAQLQPRDVPL